LYSVKIIYLLNYVFGQFWSILLQKDLSFFLLFNVAPVLKELYFFNKQQQTKTKQADEFVLTCI